MSVATDDCEHQNITIDDMQLQLKIMFNHIDVSVEYRGMIFREPILVYCYLYVTDIHNIVENLKKDVL